MPGLRAQFKKSSLKAWVRGLDQIQDLTLGARYRQINSKAISHDI